MLVRFLVVHICISLEKEVKIPMTMASFSALSLLCFFLAIVGFGFGFVRVFVAGIVGGFLLPSNHRYRVEADLSPLPATWNKQDGLGQCTLFVGL